jgi:hypothetical protein
LRIAPDRPRLARIPRELLHIGFDDLLDRGVTPEARSALLGLVADLPQVPTAADSACLVGEPDQTLPCLVALARHVGQGLRDHNVTMLHDKPRLRAERLKLMFLSQAELQAGQDSLGPWLAREAALFVRDIKDRGELEPLLIERRALAAFGSTTDVVNAPASWRIVHLGPR